MIQQKKEADALRDLLRRIPSETYFIIDDCRYISEKEDFQSHSKESLGSFSLFFIKNGSHSQVLLNSVPSLSTSESLSGAEILAVFFHLKNMKSISHGFGSLQDDWGPMNWYESQFSFLYHEHIDSLGEFRRGLCSSLLHIIISQMVLIVGALPRPSYSRSDLLEICQIIKSNPDKRYTLPELAALAGLSPRHFSRIFTVELGLSPKKYELRQRMSYARYLIHNRGLNVQETAMQCGYTDPFLFSRQYKNIYGRSPGHSKKSLL